MNHIHRLVWNTATSTWVAVAENARGRGKGSSRSALRKLLCAALTLTVAAGAQAGPAGGAVTSGTGTISQSGVVTTIKQATPNLSLNWSSFNIGKTETVNFVQPSTSAVAVNRILDTNASQILGRLNANGQVYLINPNGILFGQGSVVNVGGLFASSTGANTFITNNGSLIATGGGSIRLEAANLVNTGLIQAQTVGTQQGSIVLMGNMSTGTVNVGGTLDASAPNGGNGGFIETSAAHVKVADGVKVTTLAPSGKSGMWLIDPVSFTIAASGGDMTGAAVGDALVGGDFKVMSTAGTVSGATGLGDVNVNDVVAWSAHTLTLNATNNININANLNGSGTAKLALEYGQATPTGVGSDYFIKGTGTAASTVQAKVYLPAGQNFTTQSGSDAANLKLYTVVTTLGVAADAVNATTVPVTTLQGMAAVKNLALNYVLGADIADGATTSTWNSGAGFTPIGNVAANFAGSFDGLGHTVTGIFTKKLSTAADVGLFGAASGTSVLQNVGLIGGSVTGGAGTGGLVGSITTGTVRNSYNTGSVTGAAGTGGLIGSNTTGSVINSYASGTVIGAAGTGGLLGGSSTSNVTDSYASGSVTGAAGTGGLVGANTTGVITNSYATGNVQGAAGTGGLLGNGTSGNVTGSYATGNVTGAAGTGGLVGNNTTAIVSLSHATGLVTGLAGTGGLVGVTTGKVNTSFATGNVVGAAGAGGLVGDSTGTVSQSYALGSVIGTAATGGLVGNTTGAIDNSYAMGAVSNAGGAAGGGGLVGTTTSTITNSYAGGASTGAVSGLVSTGAVAASTVSSYWDTSTYTGTALSSGGAGLTTAQLKDKVNLTGWDSTIWTFDPVKAPILTALITDVAVTATAANVIRTYDGKKYTGFTASYAGGDPLLYSTTGLVFGGTAKDAVNVGNNYVITLSGLTSTNAQYKFTYVGGVMTINAAPVSAVAAARAYDGTDKLAGSLFSLTGLVNGENLSVAGVATMADKNVGTNKAVSIGTLALANGTGATAGAASNYVLSNTVAAETITARALTVTATGFNKVYDANNSTTVTLADNRVGGDNLTLANTGATFSDKNAAIGKTVTASGITINGTDALNYSVNTTATTTANITARALLATATGVNKVYDATTTATVTLADNRITGDAFTYTDTANFADKNVATGKLINVTGIALTGTDALNYSVNATTTTSANITPLTVAITGLSANNKVYDSTTAATLTGTATVAKLLTDVVTVNAGTSTFASAAVGNAIAVTATGFAITGTDAGNYVVTQPTGLSANITPLGLTVMNVSGTVANSKVYDGTNTATLVNGTLVGTLAADAGKVTLNQAGTFASKNVGTAIAVTANDSLSGASAANYTLIQPTGLTANITARALVATATGDNKVYDATTAATVTLGDNRIAGDIFTLTNVANFADKNAATNKSINVTSIALTGTDALNYTVNTTATTAANLTQRALTATATGANKVYDGNSATTVSLTDNRLTNDVLTVSNAGATFSDKNAETGKTVTASGITLSGTDALNYTVNTTATTAANITARTLLASANGVNKVYDATTAATVTLADNRIAGDLFSITGTANFADKNVATGKSIAVTGITLAGADALNYAVNTTASAFAAITPLTIGITGLTASNKVYDATNVASLTGVAKASSLLNDVVTVGAGIARFADVNIGTAKPVTASGFTLGGADAANYLVTQPTGLNANITPLTVTVLTIANTVANNKVYDGTTNATLVNGTLIGVLTADQANLTLTQAGTFASKNVGTAIAVTANDSLGGSAAANYSIVQPTGLTANITARTLVASTTGVSKVYDATLAASVTLADNRVTGDLLTVSGTATFFDKVVGNGKAVTVTGISLTGTDALNYSMATTPIIGVASITPRALAVSGLSASSKVYDGTTAATISGTAVLSALPGDTVSVAGNVSAAFADKNVGTNKVVNATGFSLSGADAQNYTAVGTFTSTADISQASLTVSGLTANSKTYDATTVALLGGTAKVSAIGSDVVTLGGTAVGTFGDKNAGLAKSVSTSGVTLSGSGADNTNYTLVQQTGLTADIGKANLAITGISIANKVYDGTTAATVTGTATGSALAGDTVSVAGNVSAAFADKNVGTNKVVNASGFSLSGADAGNYTTVGTLTSAAEITRLASVRWTGGGDGTNWFDPANWYKGAVPDLANVANVVIPAGVTVSFNNVSAALPTQNGAVNVDNIGTLGSLSLVAGQLNVAENLTLAGLSQSGGALRVKGNTELVSFSQSGGSVVNTGNFTVKESFTQTAPGSVKVGGNVAITQVAGPLKISDLTGFNIVLNAPTGPVTLGTVVAQGNLGVNAQGDITQTSGGLVKVGGISTLASTTGDITLGNPANDFGGVVNATGKNISLADVNVLTVVLNATGSSDLKAGGDLTISGKTLNLSTTTTNGGKTTFGNGPTTVTGKLTTNSAGAVSKTGLVSVSGAAQVIEGGKDVTSTVIAAVVPTPTPVPVPSVDGSAAGYVLPNAAQNLVSQLQSEVQGNARVKLDLADPAPVLNIEGSGIRLPDEIISLNQAE